MAGAVDRSDGESVWKREFDVEFSDLSHDWELKLVSNLPPVGQVRRCGWKKYQTKGKGNFQCTTCSNTWSSLNGVVIFHYRLQDSRGEVEMKVLRQKCGKCSTTEFEDPEWRSSERSKVLCRLLAKVKAKIYGQTDKNVVTTAPSWSGNMNGPHRSDLCEACHQGICLENDVDNLGMDRLNLNEYDYDIIVFDKIPCCSVKMESSVSQEPEEHARAMPDDSSKPNETIACSQSLYEIVKARSLALRFMAANPSCVKAIPYENSGKHEKPITMCLYVYTEGKEIPNGLIEAAKEMFEDYQIKFDDLQRRRLCKLVTRLPSSEKKRENELSDLAMKIEKNLHIFENRLNVTAVQPSYKVTDSIEQDIACVTVFALGKGKIPLGESEFLDEDQLNGCPFDVIEGYYQPSSSIKSYTSPLHGGVGIGVKEQPGVGTLGGFLQDENDKCYLLSCEHVLRSDENVNNVSREIEQPAQEDYDKELQTVERSQQVYSSLLKRQESKLEVRTEDEKLVYLDYVKKTKTKLGEVEDQLHTMRSEQPRVVAEYCCGLEENEEVELIGNAPVNIFVDAAIAEMKHEEIARMRWLKEEETNCCLYGFNMHEGYVGMIPTAEIVKLEEFDTELQDEELRFMKKGRSTGLTDGGQHESRHFFKNRDGFQANTCVGKLTHFPFQLYCKNCSPVANENMQVVDISLLKEQSCYKCKAKIACDDKKISTLWACNCLTIRKPVKPFVEKGDSGSLIFDNKGRTWGIVFGVFVTQNSNVCLAAPLDTSLRALEKKSGKKLKLWRLSMQH